MPKTPTTPYVVASERLPAAFRPRNQANLIPQRGGYLAGVRSGNALGTGLAPGGDRLLLQRQADRLRVGVQGEQALQQALRMIETEIARLLAEEDRIKATGAPLSRGRAQEVATQRKALERRSQALRKALQPNTDVGETLPPWQRRPMVVKTRGIQPMRAVPTAPAVGRPTIQAAVAGLGDFLGIPTWAMLAAGGVGAFFLFRRSRR